MIRFTLSWPASMATEHCINIIPNLIYPVFLSSSRLINLIIFVTLDCVPLNDNPVIFYTLIFACINIGIGCSVVDHNSAF